MTVTEGVRVRGCRFAGVEMMDARVLEGRVEMTWVKVWAVRLVWEDGLFEEVVSLICFGI